MVRIEPPLHRALVTAAKRSGLSLNKWVSSVLERAANA
jgi:predicted HicB family RNase H-like nuclease